MAYNPEIHHRRSIRLKNYDYSSPGMYFITICTETDYIFGRINHGNMILTPFGQIAHDQWLAIPQRFPHILLDEFIIMPNHIHGILQIIVRAPLTGALIPNKSLIPNDPLHNDIKKHDR
ncbi:MAG TPA: hypothetical protein VHR47_07200, partial [Bacillota bacterium]|nr:hypothetical protein [Bacillota bacterium]